MSTSIGPVSAAQNPSSNYINISSDYLDDRSSPESLLRSYYNAVVRQEYLRAFSYIDHRPQQPTPDEIQKFASGYEHTASVRLKIGKENGDGGAGTVWYCLPVALEATLDDGRKQVFSGSYKFMQPSAADQQMWPFLPLMITKGDLHLSHRPFEESVPASCDPDCPLAKMHAGPLSHQSRGNISGNDRLITPSVSPTRPVAMFKGIR